MQDLTLKPAFAATPQTPAVRRRGVACCGDLGAREKLRSSVA